MKTNNRFCSAVAFRSTVDNLAGREFGLLRVVALVGRRYSPSQSKTVYQVYCTGCGRTYDATRQSIVRSKACRKCAYVEAPKKLSIRVSNNKTLHEIALENNLKLDTVYKRYLRGWPVERLGVPSQKR